MIRLFFISLLLLLSVIGLVSAQTRALSLTWESWKVTDPILLERASRQIEERNVLSRNSFPLFREDDQLIVFRPKRSRGRIIMVWYGNDRDGYVFLNGGDATKLFSQSLLRAFLREDLYRHVEFQMRKGKKFYPRKQDSQRKG